MEGCDILVIGAGASGLMAGYAAAAAIRSCEGESNADARPRVVILEKMPRPGRKLMITGKGRCNVTNAKPWEDFQHYIHPNARFVRPAFYNFPPEKLLALLREFGVETVIERGDRAFPASHKAADIVDALERMVISAGASLFCGKEVKGVVRSPEGGFVVGCADGSSYKCKRLIVTTGGLSYPSTGSSGDGHRWMKGLGLEQKETFPALTALVPKGYKNISESSANDPLGPGHIDRSTPLSEQGRLLCGISLENIGLTVHIDGNEVFQETGDLDFTDGGIEGPLGFRVSRRCVHALRNGSKVQLEIDLKPGVGEERLRAKEQPLGRLLPPSIAQAFAMAALKGPAKEALRAPLSPTAAHTLKHWCFHLAGYVGYERCAVTAGGVSLEEFSSKTLECKKIPGLYLAGELLDLDADTGGYNLQMAFSTGYLAGGSAAKSLADA
ncbi:MAG: NAD(P)/FAD-dependent oxidoreductase [Bacteroidales bacterium]|nr:NAD(P)/FAD-dependent oxidoreductase [Bacteroidales bacterium]